MQKRISILLLLLCVTFALTSCMPQEVNAAYTVINNNVPQFNKAEITTDSFESYSDLDSLGRCGEAVACIGLDLMPMQERGAIGQVKPSGWKMAKYDIVDGKYLYNRCHLIGYQLSGEKANEKNLITGTRYMNVEGMLPFENMVAEYVKETGNHVMYRVAPVFEGDNLLAKGVQMEAYSVEDDGKGVSFNVFVSNIQPGVEIDYSDGSSRLESGEAMEESQKKVYEKTEEEKAGTGYILNTNTKKYHKQSCSSVQSMKPDNRETFNGPKAWLMDNGYSPCGSCKP